MPEWLTSRSPIGWFIALVVGIVTLVLAVTGKLDQTHAWLIGGLALSRLL